MVFGLDSIGTPGAIPFIANQDILFLKYNTTCLIIMLILPQETITFSNFPVKTRVASFMAYGFHAPTFRPSGACNIMYNQTPAPSGRCIEHTDPF